MRFANPSKKTRVIASTKGHAIEFPGRIAVDAKGKPADPKFKPPHGAVVSEDGLVYVHVPPLMHQEVVTAGMEPQEAIEEGDEPTIAKRPENPLKFEEELFAAFAVLVEANQRESFAGSGLPRGDAVEKITGWAVTNAEIKDAWPKYLQSKNT